MRHGIWITILLAGCAGACRAHNSEEDNRRSISADQGTTFYLSLPDTMNDRAVFPSGILELLSDTVDGATHRRTPEFAARGMKEVEIRIGKEFSPTVRVVPSSDRPGMHVRTP